MRFLYIAITALLFFQVTTVAATTPPTIDEVLAFSPERQFEYLSKISPETLQYYYSNNEELVTLLLEIAAKINRASELAMYYLNLHVALLSSAPCTPSFIALTESIFIEQKLSQIITQPHFDIKVRRGAILAHANLFRPSERLVQFYTIEIEEGNLDDRGLIENILIAFSQYRSKLDMELPEIVEKRLSELVTHHSGGVRFQAFSMLVASRGLDYLPDLFTMLESNNYRSGSNQRIISSILSLDSTQSTIDRLRNIRDKLGSGNIKKMIDRNILPENMERLKKNREANKRMQADQKNAALFCDR